ncbi:LamG domain-containing protein [Marinactinospora endophytica]
MLCLSPPVASADEGNLHSPSERAALEEAAEKGERVEIEALRAERRDVYANPDGTFTAVEHIQPVRSFREGAWVDADATLVKHEDGSISPVAATLGMKISNGGVEPLVELTRAGKRLAIGWPEELPEPRIEGTEALYGEVLPGVDLILRADVDGVSHVLVVKNEEAAASGELAELRLLLETDGVEVRERADGGLDALDTGAGGAVFEAPVPLMWDSGRDIAGTRASAQNSDVEATPNLAEGPAESSQVAELDVRIDGGELVITPDPALLSSPDTVFPLYIDPVWKTSTASAWAMVSSGYGGQEYWKFSGKSDEGVGRCPQLAGDPYSCVNSGTKRLFYRVPTSSYQGKQILGAEFAVTLRHAYNTTPRAVQLHRTGGISTSTSWDNQPSWSQLLDTESPDNPASSCTRTNQNVRFDASAAVEQAVSGNWSSVTFGLRSANENDYTHWKRFCGNGHLEVHYNTAPGIPRQADLQLEPGGACVYGASRPYVDNPPRVSAYLRDPDHSSSNVESVRAQFRVFWNDASGVEQRREFTTSYKGANSRFYYQIPSDIPQNVTIGWIVRAHDGNSWSDWSWAGGQNRCEFVYDATSPDEPIVESGDYPDDDQWHTGVGSYGHFSIGSSSPDVVSYRYGVNEHPSAGNTLEPARPGAKVSLEFVPLEEGPHSLYVEAVDAAGRVSSRANHLFLVGPGTPASPHWPLDDPQGSAVAADVSGDADEGDWTYPASAGPGVTFGTTGPVKRGASAALFDGTPDAYLQPEAGYLGDSSWSFALAGWARIDDTGRDQTVISQDSNGIVDFSLGYSAAHRGWSMTFPDYQGGGEATVVAPESVVPGTWTHLVAVNDGGQGQVTLYVNGEEVTDGVFLEQATEETPVFLQEEQRAGSMSLRTYARIGRTLEGEEATNHFKGALSDLRFFERIVTSEEVEVLYSLPAQRVAYWPLNDAQNGTSPEAAEGEPVSLAGDAGIFVGDPFSGESALVGDGHLLLDGAGDHAATVAAAADTTGSFTVSVRARLASAAPGRSMSVLSQAGESESAFDLRYSVEKDRWEAVFSHTDSAGTMTTDVVNDSVSPSSEQRGDHLALVYDAFSREIRLYVNGQLTQSSVSPHSHTWSAGGPFVIGRSLEGSSWGGDFSGSIDDVRVYSGAADVTFVQRLASLQEQPDL